MSWYSLYGATTLTRDRAQSEARDLGDDRPWWHLDLGGSTSSRLSQRWVWDLGIGGSNHVWMAWRHDVD